MVIESLCSSYPHQCVDSRDATWAQASVWTSANLSEDKGFCYFFLLTSASGQVQPVHLPNSLTNWKVLWTMTIWQEFGGVNSLPPAERGPLPSAPSKNHYFSEKKVPSIQLTLSVRFALSCAVPWGALGGNRHTRFPCTSPCMLWLTMSPLSFSIRDARSLNSKTN